MKVEGILKGDDITKEVGKNSSTRRYREMFTSLIYINDIIIDTK